jgi:hypothetical protein
MIKKSRSYYNEREVIQEYKHTDDLVAKVETIRVEHKDCKNMRTHMKDEETLRTCREQ